MRTQRCSLRELSVQATRTELVPSDLCAKQSAGQIQFATPSSGRFIVAIQESGNANTEKQWLTSPDSPPSLDRLMRPA